MKNNVEPVIPEGEMLADPAESTEPAKPVKPAVPAEPAVLAPLNNDDSTESMDNTETSPPLTPSSEVAGEASTDEEPTVEEVRTIIDAECVIGTRRSTEVDTRSWSELRDSLITRDLITGDLISESETSSGSEDEETTSKQKASYPLFNFWFIIWMIALAAGILAFYIQHIHGF